MRSLQRYSPAQPHNFFDANTVSQWHAFIAEDPYSRVYVFIQKGDDEGSSEEQACMDEEEQQEPGADARLAAFLADAKWEAEKRNADDERRQIDPG